jgi:hypothetical protein
MFTTTREAIDGTSGHAFAELLLLYSAGRQQGIEADQGLPGPQRLGKNCV